MSIAYLNGAFVPLEDAHISVMDRGFLFGDGVYEAFRAASASRTTSSACRTAWMRCASATR